MTDTGKSLCALAWMLPSHLRGEPPAGYNTPTGVSLPMECNVVEFTFWQSRVRKLRFHGSVSFVDGSPFNVDIDFVKEISDFTMPAKDEIDVYLQGVWSFEYEQEYSPGRNLTIVLDFQKECYKVNSDQLLGYLPLYNFLINTFTAGSSTKQFVGYVASVLSLDMNGSEVNLGKEYRRSFPMYCQPGQDFTAGSITIEPSEFWQYGGLYDPATGSKVIPTSG